MKGGPIKPAQITCQGQEVTFQYKDHRDNKRKQHRMGVDEFVKKLLWHVPEGGIHVVRHYGLDASKKKSDEKATKVNHGNRKA
jgi:hypothetical protein